MARLFEGMQIDVQADRRRRAEEEERIRKGNEEFAKEKEQFAKEKDQLQRNTVEINKE